MAIQLNEKGKLDAIAFPGGYSIRYLCEDGETVCANCANEALADPDCWEGQRPHTAFIHWEGPPITCSHCNEELPSEYGDPEADPEAEFAHYADLRLKNNGGIRLPVCIADAELLDTENTWPITSDKKKVTCQKCIDAWAKGYRWAGPLGAECQHLDYSETMDGAVCNDCGEEADIGLEEKEGRSE